MQLGISFFDRLPGIPLNRHRSVTQPGCNFLTYSNKLYMIVGQTACRREGKIKRRSTGWKRQLLGIMINSDQLFGEFIYKYIYFKEYN